MVVTVTSAIYLDSEAFFSPLLTVLGQSSCQFHSRHAMGMHALIKVICNHA